MMPITIAPRRFTGYIYLFHLALMTILHFFTFSLRVFLSPLLNHNGRQEGYQASSLSLKGRLFIAEQCWDTTTSTIKVSATTRVPVEGLLSPTSLTGL
jgi:hypothetical protein